MSVYIIRHGERCDEADADAWKRRVPIDARSSGRNINAVNNDPPLTPAGCNMARDAAITLQRLAPDTRFNAIYCSHMRRCVQTAIPFALAYNVPIYLVKEISLSAIGVYNMFVKTGAYDYCSLSELRSLCPPEVEVNEVNTSFPTTVATEFASRLPTKRVSRVLPDWCESVHGGGVPVSARLVVAHRETIREFIRVHKDQKIAMPYCCISQFDVSADPSSGMTKLQLRLLVDKDGNSISV